MLRTEQSRQQNGERAKVRLDQYNGRTLSVILI